MHRDVFWVRESVTQQCTRDHSCAVWNALQHGIEPRDQGTAMLKGGYHALPLLCPHCEACGAFVGIPCYRGYFKPLNRRHKSLVVALWAVTSMFGLWPCGRYRPFCCAVGAGCGCTNVCSFAELAAPGRRWTGGGEITPRALVLITSWK